MIYLGCICVWSHYFMANRWGNNGDSDRLNFLGSKITADGDCSHEIKGCLLLGRKVITNLDCILKSRDTANKGPSSQSYANKYLKLNDLAIENNGVDGNLVWCFSIPIYSSYDPEFLNNPCSSIIQKIINSHSENLENGMVPSFHENLFSWLQNHCRLWLQPWN